MYIHTHRYRYKVAERAPPPRHPDPFCSIDRGAKLRSSSSERIRLRPRSATPLHLPANTNNITTNTTTNDNSNDNNTHTINDNTTKHSSTTDTTTNNNINDNNTKPTTSNTNVNTNTNAEEQHLFRARRSDPFFDLVPRRRFVYPRVRPGLLCVCIYIYI